MMEIRFRAWVKGLKKDLSLPDLKIFDYKEEDFPKMANALAVYSETDFTFRNGLGISSSAEYDAILMQYTGLKDRNGVEIYEGDILEINQEIGDGTLKSRGFVKYHECCFIVERGGEKVSYNNGKFLEFINWPNEYFKNCKAIGNIYENPELLED